MVAIDKSHQHLIGESLVEQTLDRISGHHQSYCIEERPARTYYLSNLSPIYGVNGLRDFVSQIQPSHVAVDFKPEEEKLPVLLSFELYYPSFPTFEEYTELQERFRRAARLKARDRMRGELRTGQAIDDDGDADAEEDAASDGGVVRVESEDDATVELSDVTDADLDEDDLYSLNRAFFRRLDITYVTTVDVGDADAESKRVTDDLQNIVNTAFGFEQVSDLENGWYAFEGGTIPAESTLDDVPKEISREIGGVHPYHDPDVDEELGRVSASADEHPFVALDDDIDEEDYNDLDLSDLSEDDLGELRQSLDRAGPDKLRWNIRFNVTDWDTENQVSLQLQNHPIRGADGLERLNDPSKEEPRADEFGVAEVPQAFNPKIETQARVERYEFDLAPEDFRYDQSFWAKGHHCSTHVETLDEATQFYAIETTAVPQAPVYEFAFNNEYDQIGATKFDTLAEPDAIDKLEKIADGMNDFYDEWKYDLLPDFEQEHGSSSDEVKQFKQAMRQFEVEKERFKQGLKILREEPMVRRAFQMMNRVNSRVHDSFDGWRLFQLVFIISNLPGVAARDPTGQFDKYNKVYKVGEEDVTDATYHDIVDVLWFPTGGGKTEAYLGLILWNLFFDRMRGKEKGVTAWIRFPLRLLSRQQKERFQTALLHAEVIRQVPESEGGLDATGEPFSLGFFVGGQDTPNAVGTSRDAHRENFAADSPAKPALLPEEEKKTNTLIKECAVLEECPLCESNIEIRYVTDENRVVHRCTGDDCLGDLPLYVVDREIYRYVPSVLLGSLDKVAVMAMQDRFANIFGNVTTRCKKHGYGYSDTCPARGMFDCDEKGRLEDVDPNEEFYDPIPTLHLIDEVHLLNEELGAFASHYETTYLTLCERISTELNDSVSKTATPKIICSTATIADYEGQMENLFQRESIRFPEEGPELGRTFYGELNKKKVERQYLGITPNNRTHLYAVLDLIKQYHELIRDDYELSPDELAELVGLNPGDLSQQECEAILNLYETSLVYFTNKKEVNTYRKNIRNQIREEMRNDGYDGELIERQLTADTESTDLLAALEDPHELDLDFDERIDTVPATSFVGHGIDVDRFNFMVFFGYPSQTFQYIQASSRVGRQDDVPGFVLDVFRPFDRRDRHRFRYFEKFHEYLNRSVEPVPIDRWAKFAVEETFPGVMMSFLLQYWRPWLYRSGREGPDGDPINIRRPAHLYEVMVDPNEFPEFTQNRMWDDLQRAFSLNSGRFTSNKHFAN